MHTTKVSRLARCAVRDGLNISMLQTLSHLGSDDVSDNSQRGMKQLLEDIGIYTHYKTERPFLKMVHFANGNCENDSHQ